MFYRVERNREKIASVVNGIRALKYNTQMMKLS